MEFMEQSAVIRKTQQYNNHTNNTECEIIKVDRLKRARRM